MSESLKPAPIESDDDGFDPTCGERPYRIGAAVAWHDEHRGWRVEVAGSSDGVGAIVIPAEMMIAIVEDRTTDPARMMELVALFKDDIEYEIAVCATQHFALEMGIVLLPKLEAQQA